MLPVASRRFRRAYLEPAAGRVVIFHMIMEGECYVERVGEPAVRLMAGDVVLFPHGDAL